MNQWRIAGGIGFGAVAIASVFTFAGVRTSTANDNTPVSAISCAWSASDQDTDVITVFNGPNDCPLNFSVIAETGFNWQIAGTGWNIGQLECVLSDSGESLSVYEADQDSEPLTLPGNALCSDLEGVGWIPS
jgi:hypothetical protein